MAQPAATTRVTPRAVVVTVLGALQIPAWGSTVYLLAVLAKPMTAETGWAYDRGPRRLGDRRRRHGCGTLRFRLR